MRVFEEFRPRGKQFDMRVDVQVGIRSVGTALRLAESVLLAGGQRQARRNAWRAVCENRRHAADRERAAALVVPAGGGGRPS